MRLVFLGSGAFGLPTLEALHTQHEVVAVVSQPDKPAGRRRQLTPTPIAQWSESQGLETIKSEDVNTPEFIEQIKAYQPDAAVIIAFGQKLSDPLIDSLGQLAVNLHASLLPKYRGAAPINWAMIQGETVAGVSVIALAQRMDAGVVYATAELAIDPLETAGELHDRLAQLGLEAILGVLKDLQQNTLSPIDQDDTLATRAPKLSKADGTVDFNQSAEVVRCRIHGLSPWPGCRVGVLLLGSDTPESQPITLGRVAVLQASAQGATAGSVLPNHHIATADSNSVIEILEVQPPGKRMMPLNDYLRGNAWPKGTQLVPWASAKS